MSALGQKQTLKRLHPMSALPPKADIAGGQLNVRFVPKGDIRVVALSFFGAAGCLSWFERLFGEDSLGGVLCQATPALRHFQQDRAVVWTVHMARQFYALSGEVPIRITPFHSFSHPGRYAASGLEVPFNYRLTGSRLLLRCSIFRACSRISVARSVSRPA